MNDIFDNFDDADDEPFVPVHTSQPAKKRGRPTGTSTAAKPKAKAAPKPKFNVPRFKENLVDALMGVATELLPTTATHADKLRIAADLLEVIEKAKA